MDRVSRDLSAQTVERAYGAWSRVYDGLCGPLFRPAHVAAARAANRIGGDVLEAGVGTGLVLPLYRADARVTGIDLSRGMLVRAAERVRKAGLSHVRRLVVADIETLPHPDASFDVIVLPFVLTLVQWPEGVLCNCRRMLRPHGEIIVVSHFRSRVPAVAAFETCVAPLVSRIGLRPDFPVSRLEKWCAASSMTLIADAPAGPLGVYRCIRIGHARHSPVIAA